MPDRTGFAAGALLAFAGAPLAVSDAGAAARPAFVVTAAAPAKEAGGMSAMVHLYARGATDRRPGLRTIITGADPGASLQVLASRGSCSALRRNPRAGVKLWSGSADANGVAMPGLRTPQRVALADFGFGKTLGIAAAGNTGSSKPTVQACGRTQAVRALQPGSRPTVVLGTLFGNSAGSGAGTVAGMMQMNMQLRGVVRLTTLFTGLSEGSYRLSVTRPGCAENVSRFNIDVDTNEGVVTLKTVRMDRSTLRMIAGGDSHFALEAQSITEPFWESVACSSAVRIGKVLGVNR